jgi:hypothetical protein
MRSMLVSFFDIKGIVHTEFLLACQISKYSILHTIVMFYGDYMEMCEDFDPNFDEKKLDVASRPTHGFTLPSHQRISDYR